MNTPNATETMPAKPIMNRSMVALLPEVAWILLKVIASLKLTLVLLAMAIFLIFAGTLAQAKIGMWDVLAQYFKAWFVFIELSVFFPKVWFPEFHETFKPSQGFWFPGGMFIGWGMMSNLVFAHFVKFRLHARGMRLFSGLLALALGVAITYAVIAFGQFQQGLRAEPLVSWQLTAMLTIVGAVAISVSLLLITGALAGQALADPKSQIWPKAGLTFVAAIMSSAACIALYVFQNDISAVRILWQLIQGAIAGIVLLGGCWLLFEKRAGIVLLHSGIALMMFGEAWVSYQAREQQMTIVQGDTAAFAHDIRKTELAIVEVKAEEERHIVVPERFLTEAAQYSDSKAANERSWIKDARLPFDIQILSFYKNSSLEAPASDSTIRATKGKGKEVVAIPKKVNSGASSDSKVDLSAAYVKLSKHDSGEELGVYLVAVLLGMDGHGDRVKVGDKTYEIFLRFERDYKPYSVTAMDIRSEKYPGTNTPKTYESKIRMNDAKSGVDREVIISMNNPFRYLGETFYQSGFDDSGRKTTTLQIVTNSGWMIPYVACMIVLTGLVFQLGRTLLMFLQSELSGIPNDDETDGDRWAHLPAGHRPAPRQPLPAALAGQSWWSWFIPSGVAGGLMLIALLNITYGMRMPHAKPDQFDLYAFGKIPVMSGGRAKPIDSLARETLLAMSNRVTFKGADDKSQPAAAWLLETIANPEEAEKLRVLRLDNEEVAHAIGLTLQKDFRYSMAEIIDHQDKFKEQMKLLREKANIIDNKENHREQLAKLLEEAKEDTSENKSRQGKIAELRTKIAEKYSTFDNQLLQLDRRMEAMQKTTTAFQIHDLSAHFTKQELAAKSPEVMQRFSDILERVAHLYKQLDQMQSPLAIPIIESKMQESLSGKKWLPLSIAMAMYDLQQLTGNDRIEEERAVTLWRNIIAAYREKNPGEFNHAVEVYHSWFAKLSRSDCKADKIASEAWFNQFNPFGWTQGILLYLLALVVSVAGLAAFRVSLGKAAFWLLVVVFLLHTGALVARMYIAGRPPVTNLYSSAVFIGWATVLFGLILEACFRLGVGNVLSSVGGFASLMIAYYLSFNGDDTIGVMQAVLDTQFWLATHVVCITLGYSATFAAGILGIYYILFGIATPILEPPIRKILTNMIYGVVCFALLLSFYGTVLGGLWADDSWGRFWGWDPKENGALIIVLWNAFILHARWAGVAKQRGLAVLAVAGNIVTIWSWFGTNQLGVGLHSYGFTKGVLVALAYSVGIHAFIIGLGLLPRSLWWSYREQKSPVT